MIASSEWIKLQPTSSDKLLSVGSVPLVEDDLYGDQLLEEIPTIADNLVDNILSQIKFPSGPVIDIGCGTGVLVKKNA